MKNLFQFSNLLLLLSLFLCISCKKNKPEYLILGNWEYGTSYTSDYWQDGETPSEEFKTLDSWYNYGELWKNIQLNEDGSGSSDWNIDSLTGVFPQNFNWQVIDDSLIINGANPPIGSNFRYKVQLLTKSLLIIESTQYGLTSTGPIYQRVRNEFRH